MSNVQIPNLPVAISISGSEQLEAVQEGTSVRITTSQIANLAGGQSSSSTNFVANIAALRILTVTVGVNVIVGGYYADGDGGGGFFYGVKGAAPGTYVENYGTIIVPTGGDGSSAWLRVPAESMTLAQFGAKGDGTTDDHAAIQAALNAAGNNMTVYLQGTSGSIFYSASSFTVAIGVTLAGLGWLNESGYNTVTRIGPALAPFESTILLGSGATIICDQLSAVRDLHVLPYGMTFPQSNSIGWTGTAINAGTNVTLERLQIVGFNQAVYINRVARVFCSRVLFDCNNGIYVYGSGDPTYLEYCEGWPFAAQGYTSPVTTPAEQLALIGRSGTAFAYDTQNDAGQSQYCFSFGYTVGHRVTNLTGMRFVGCGADGVQDAASGYTGLIVEGTSNDIVFTNCAFVSQAVNVNISLQPLQNVFFMGGTLGSSASDTVKISGGGIFATNVYFQGGLASAVNVSNTNAKATFDSCIFNNYTTALLNNSGNSPYINLNSTNDISSGISCPIYSGTQVFYDLTAQSTVNLPIQGNYFRISGATAITAFTGGWPGRTVTFGFLGGNTVASSATLRLNSTFSTTSSDTLTLICDGVIWYEVTRSVNV